MVAKSIGGQATFGQVEVGLAAGNKIDDTRANHRPDHLGDDVWEQIRGWKTFPDVQTNGDRGVQVTPGNMANGIGHGEHGETEGQGYSVEPDAHVGECCGKDCTTTATED